MFRKGRSSLASVVVTFPETSAYNWKRDTQQWIKFHDSNPPNLQKVRCSRSFLGRKMEHTYVPPGNFTVCYEKSPLKD